MKLLLFVFVLFSTLLLSSCGQNGPRNMRAQKDELNYEGRAPLEGHVKIATATPVAGQNTSDDVCYLANAVNNDPLFNTTLKLCRPDSTNETLFAMKFEKAPAEKVCFFPVYEPTNETGDPCLPKALGTAKCFGFQDNSYQTFYLPRDRASNGNYNYQGSAYKITGVMAMLDVATQHNFPCPSATNYTSLCPGTIANYVLAKVKNQVAYQAAQDYCAAFQETLNLNAYLFLDYFYKRKNYRYFTLPN